jgi:hypothetical protein
MRQQKRKNTVPGTKDRIQGAWREEIAGDVFEIWVGISRLMARVGGLSQQTETGIGAVKRAAGKKSAALR